MGNHTRTGAAEAEAGAEAVADAAVSLGWSAFFLINIGITQNRKYAPHAVFLITWPV